MKVSMFNVLNFIELKIKENNELLTKKDVELPKNYKTQLENYNEAYTILKNELITSWEFNCQNIIFNVLKENFGEHDTKIIFWGDEEITIDKNTLASVDGGFIFIHPKNKKDLHDFFSKGFNIDNIKEIQTIKEPKK